jgi:acetyltransferase-like isoleucine patch superfamily enzyme
MLLLPLIPAFMELRGKSDAVPLNVVQQNAGEIRFFANGFRSYIQGIKEALQESSLTGMSFEGMLPDGTGYLIPGSATQSLDRLLAEASQPVSVVIASMAALHIPSDVTFNKDIYAGGCLTGAGKNSYRAILGERDVHLGDGSRVLRWVHAVGAFRANSGCQLSGRVSSDRSITLQRSCSFLRLNAPHIEIGVDIQTPPMLSTTDLTPPPAQHRVLHDGDFEIQPGEIVRGNVVIRGRLRIGAGACIYGSVKSDKDMILGDGVTIEGSLISASKMHVGRGCLIHGPVIAERHMRVQSGTRCGRPQKPTTMSAPYVEIEEGVVVHGSLWAREYGTVVVAL